MIRHEQAFCVCDACGKEAALPENDATTGFPPAGWFTIRIRGNHKVGGMHYCCSSCVVAAFSGEEEEE